MPEILDNISETRVALKIAKPRKLFNYITGYFSKESVNK